MADPTPSPRDITDASKAAQPIREGEPKTARDTVRPFRPYMEEQSNPLASTGKTPQVSPFDLERGRVPASGPNFHTLQEQAKAAQSTLGDINNQLNTPKLKLKQSTKYLLKNKLSSAKGHIKTASEKAEIGRAHV